MYVYSCELEFYSYLTSPVPSYTLFGALCWSARFLFGEEKLKDILQMADRGEILISSLMPIINEEKQFFKPFLEPKILTKKDREELNLENDTQFRSFLKKFKKLEFVPFKILKKILNGQITNDRDLAFEVFEVKNVIKDNKSEDNKNVSKDKNVNRRPYILLSIPHANINRITGSTSEGGTLYFEETLGAAADSYFFLVGVEDENLISDIVKPALNLLEDWGLGGNRSTGFGSFKLKRWHRKPEIEEYVQNRTQTLITLSKTLPTRNVNFGKSFYQIETFRGTVDSGFFSKLWKDKTLYIKEGSYLRFSKDKSAEIPGKLWKVFNDLNVYQHGKAFPLFVKGAVKDDKDPEQ